MEENDTITHMNLRLTECGQESEYCISQILNKNREKERENRLKAEPHAAYGGGTQSAHARFDRQI